MRKYQVYQKSFLGYGVVNGARVRPNVVYQAFRRLEYEPIRLLLTKVGLARVHVIGSF